MISENFKKNVAALRGASGEGRRMCKPLPKDIDGREYCLFHTPCTQGVGGFLFRRIQSLFHDVFLRLSSGGKQAPHLPERVGAREDGAGVDAAETGHLHGVVKLSKHRRSFWTSGVIVCCASARVV